MLALGKIPISRAIIDGGITPYQLPFLVRKLLLARDVLSFKMAANSRKVLEAAFPPERFTPAGHDPKKEYDAMEAYLKTFSDPDDSQHILVRQQLCASEVPCENRHKNHLLVWRRRKEGPQTQHSICQALFSADSHPRYSQDGPCGVGDGASGGVLPVCGKISGFASGGSMT